MSAASKTKPPFKDRIIPWYFVMAFMVIFAVNGLFVYLATHTHTGVITENAYEKGLKFDDIVKEVREQKNEEPSHNDRHHTSSESTR